MKRTTEAAKHGTTYLPVEAAVALCAIRVSPVEMAGTTFWNLNHDDISGDAFT